MFCSADQSAESLVDKINFSFGAEPDDSLSHAVYNMGVKVAYREDLTVLILQGNVVYSDKKVLWLCGNFLTKELFKALHHFGVIQQVPHLVLAFPYKALFQERIFKHFI
jgi:uncharacterized membrane protein YecN with MAPEG domain